MILKNEKLVSMPNVAFVGRVRQWVHWLKDRILFYHQKIVAFVWNERKWSARFMQADIFGNFVIKYMIANAHSFMFLKG